MSTRLNSDLFYYLDGWQSNCEEIIIPKYPRTFQKVKDGIFNNFNTNASRAKN